MNRVSDLKINNFEKSIQNMLMPLETQGFVYSEITFFSCSSSVVMIETAKRLQN